MADREESFWRKTAAVSTALALLLTCSPVAARTQVTVPQGPESPIEIAHDPLACMTPALAPEVDATLRRDMSTSARRARRTTTTREWRAPR